MAAETFQEQKGQTRLFLIIPKQFIAEGKINTLSVAIITHLVEAFFSGTTRQAEQLIKEHSGTGQILGSNRERVDFGKQIGYYVDPQTNEKIPTTMGIIHYSKDGAHIVPARPKD